MSRTPFFFVERFNENTKQYELQHPFVKVNGKMEPADLFPYNGCHELFSIVEDRPEDLPSMRGIHSGLPDDVSKEIQKEYDECTENFDTSFSMQSYTPHARWFTYADMYIYCLEHPEILDYEEMAKVDYEQKIMKSNPLKTLKKRVDAFLEVMDAWDWENDYSLIRIVYWIE